MQFTTITTFVALLASGALVSAAPTTNKLPAALDKRCAVNLNAQSCTCEDSWHASEVEGLRSYTVHIGEIFSSDTCADIQTRLTASFPNINHWSCQAGSECNYITLKFTIAAKESGHEVTVNNDLKATWPAVNGFNCPAY